MPRKKKILPPEPDKKNDLLEKWKSRCTRAKKLRKDWQDQFEVERCERYIIGNQSDTGVQNPNDPVFNHTLATLQVIKPSIFFQNPKFFVRSKPGKSSPVGDENAAIAEGVLDTISSQDNNLKNAAGFATWQAFTRVGVLKIIHDPKMEPNPQKGLPTYMTHDDGLPVIGPDGQSIALRDPRTGQDIIEPNEIMTDQVFRFGWVDACNMLLPDEGPDMSKWSWIGEEVCVLLEDAKEDTRFSHRSELKSNSSYYKSRDDGEKTRYSSEDKSKEEEYFKYYECYDIKKKKVMIWADGQDFDDYLMYDDLQDGIEDHPYAILQGFIPVINPEPLPWPMPFIYSWLDAQSEYNIRRKQITEGAKRSARKGVYDTSTFPNVDEAIKYMQSSDDLQFVQINNTQRPPVILDTPPISGDIFRDIPLLQNDWQLITGRSGARLASPDANTATEATFVEKATSLRDNDLLSAVTDWLSCAGRKMLQLVKANLTLDLWIKMRGFSDEEFKKYIQNMYGIPPETIEFLPGLKEIFRERYGKEKWMRATREQIQFEADVGVIPGSFRPRNLDTEREQWLTFLKIVGQFPQLALSRELLKETASKFEYISDRMLDELTALAQKMIQVNANQAGRSGNNGQGGANGQGSGAQQQMAGMIGGMR